MTMERPSATIRRMKKGRMNLPRCRGIDPDYAATTGGYYCKNCGGELIERGDWFRHGTSWAQPHAWLSGGRRTEKEES